MKNLKQLALSGLTYRKAESARTALYACAFYTGLAALLGAKRRRGAAILCLHSVSESAVFWDNRLPPAAFERLVSFLQRRYQIVPICAILEQLDRGVDPPRHWVAITFDDGYADNARIAAPILDRHGATATFFPTIDAIRTGSSQVDQVPRPFFYDLIQQIIDKTSRDTIAFPVHSQMQAFNLRSSKRRDDAVLRIVLSLRERPDEERLSAVRQLAEICDVSTETDASLYMSKEDLQSLVHAGMEIGSHSITHPDLSSLQGDALYKELSESKDALERWTGSKISAFAYPFGKKRHYNAAVIGALRRAGYRYAVTTNFGMVTAKSDPFELPRIAARDAALVRLRANLLGLHL